MLIELFLENDNLLNHFQKMIMILFLENDDNIIL